jgi:hypothetical protein
MARIAPTLNSGTKRRSPGIASTFAIAAALGASLAGCDTLPHARVINNTGAPVLLHFDDGGVIGEARLGKGESRTVMAYGDEPGLGVKTADCTRLYRWPHMSLNFPFEVYKDGYPITVQVQPDMRIYLLSHGRRRCRQGRSSACRATAFR